MEACLYARSGRTHGGNLLPVAERKLQKIGRTEQTAAYAARPISRVALREVLFEGLEDVVAFSKTFELFERTPDGPIIARFEDGSSAEGDLLVGADGASSRVRRQLLPDAQRIDTGVGRGFRQTSA